MKEINEDKIKVNLLLAKLTEIVGLEACISILVQIEQIVERIKQNKQENEKE